jgi:hypothetical protein
MRSWANRDGRPEGLCCEELLTVMCDGIKMLSFRLSVRLQKDGGFRFVGNTSKYAMFILLGRPDSLET